MAKPRMFELELRMENAALVGEGAVEELVRILQNMVDRVKLLSDYDGFSITLRDINGNRVGYAHMDEVDPAENDNLEEE